MERRYAIPNKRLRMHAIGIWALTLLLLASCGTDPRTIAIGESQVNAEPRAINEVKGVRPVQASDFIHRLYLERDDYREGDEVTFISELEYVGDRESVTINHAMTPFSYAILESSDKYLFPFIIDQPLIYTTLYPGKPHVEKYSSGWAYLKDDPNDIIGNPADVPFPAGEYTVVGSAEFNVGEFGKENENKGRIEVVGEEISFMVAPQ